jgi:hypothetical protein
MPDNNAIKTSNFAITISKNDIFCQFSPNLVTKDGIVLGPVLD